MKKVIVLIGLVLFASCAEKLMEKPENLIPKEKMVDLLRDLALLNAARTTNVGILQKNKLEPMAYLYSKYGIDSTQFSDSDRYYASLPEEYEEIYAQVAASIEVEKEEMQEKKRIKDSIMILERERKRENTGIKDSLP